MHDTLVLILFWREASNAVRSCRKADLAWVVIVGGGLALYAVAGATIALHSAADTLRRQNALWVVGLPLTAFALGTLIGNTVTKAVAAHALAPFLRALPLSTAARRRAATVAAVTFYVPLTGLFAASVGAICLAISMPYPSFWVFCQSAIFAVGFALAMVLRLRHAFREPHGVLSIAFQPRGGILGPSIAAVDKTNPAWAGSWAWNLTDGRLSFTVWNVGLAILLSAGALISIAASLAQHWALPAVVTGVLGGLLIFMMSLRCHPLGSAVFRSAPIRFVRVWLSMLRLPAALSALFFVLPAGAAIAAEPSAWALPVGGGVGLLLLNTTYAIFAGYFIWTPAVAALSFIVALAFAEYETLEYGRTVILGFVALLAWLWFRARRRFYHG